MADGEQVPLPLTSTIVHRVVDRYITMMLPVGVPGIWRIFDRTLTAKTVWSSRPKMRILDDTKRLVFDGHVL